MSAVPVAHEDLPAAQARTHTIPVGLKVPPAEQQFAIHEHPVQPDGPAPAWWLLGAHGGAGVTALVKTWQPAADARRGWPSTDRYPSVLVVARTHRHGLTSAHILLRQAAAGLIGNCTVLGLLTVADHEGTLPATLRRQRAVVEELAPAAWQIPFIPAFRQLDHDQLPVWSPRDAPSEPVGRFARGPDPTTVVQPVLVEIGVEIFAAARRAATKAT